MQRQESLGKMMMLGEKIMMAIKKEAGRSYVARYYHWGYKNEATRTQRSHYG